MVVLRGFHSMSQWTQSFPYSFSRTSTKRVTKLIPCTPWTTIKLRWWRQRWWWWWLGLPGDVKSLLNITRRRCGGITAGYIGGRHHEMTRDITHNNNNNNNTPTWPRFSPASTARCSWDDYYGHDKRRGRDMAWPGGVWLELRLDDDQIRATQRHSAVMQSPSGGIRR